MANVPDELKYTAEHEWVRTTGADTIEIGITDYAQGELGDIVFVNLPSVGATFDADATFGTIEAVKAVSDLYCPVAGEVTEANNGLDADPAAVNRSPYDEGWMIRLRVTDATQLDSLLSAEGYRAHVGA